MTKPRGGKSPSKSLPAPAAKGIKPNAQSVRAVLADGAPKSWRSITTALGVKAPHEIKRARQLLKGMIRQGEVEEQAQRQYVLLSKQQSATDVRTSGGSEQAPTRADTQLHTGVVAGYAGKLTLAGLSIQKSTPGRQTIAVRPGDEVDYRVEQHDADPYAQVVAMRKASARPAVGIVNRRGRHAVLEPLARSFEGRMRLLDGNVNAAHGDAVRAEIVDQDRHGLVGRILAVLPSASVVEQAIDATLESLDIIRDWPDAVTRAAQRLPSRVQRDQHADRVDLTTTPLVTIDGATAKDFDDAVYAKALGGQKGWRLVVAIADVANYVKPRSALDTEAAQRTTSVYLPGHVVPMLPEAISNELCSLKPNVFRLALVCEMQVSTKGIVRDYAFYDGLIRSHGRLTYEEVQAHLDSGAALPCAQEDRASVAKSIAALADVHEAFRQAKDQRGGLDFDSREGVIDIEQGHVTGVREVARLQAHQIIEEAMINANVCAAAYIEANDSRSLYRLHEAPDALKLETLRQDLMAIGLRLPEGVPSSLTYQTLLRDIAAKEQGWLYQQLVLRSMKQAVYGPHNAGHFGLGLERYMHFPSPIRRYPDLLVHRAIKSIVQGKTNRAGWVPTLQQLVDLGEHCSTNERRAETAGWTVEAWLKCDLVKQHMGESLPGTIAGVTEFGLFVDLDGYYVQGLLHISDLGADYFRYDSRKQSLIGDRSGKRFTLGEAVMVTVANVEPPQGKIELQLVAGSGRQKPASKNSKPQSGKTGKSGKANKLGKTGNSQAQEKPQQKAQKKKKQTTPKAVKRRKSKSDG
ncbi:MAG: ribonuclease R [Proteobacteria bacterium]|nr:ribonuclease R [Pseudomonadota bacterium]